MKTKTQIYHISLSSSHNENFFGQSYIENQNSYFVFKTFFQQSCR